MSGEHTKGPSLVERLKHAAWRIRTGDAVTVRALNVEADLEEAAATITDLLEALALLVDQDAVYSGSKIEIQCNSHNDAIHRVSNARAALLRARAT